MEFLAFVAFVGLVINSVLARSLIWLFLWFDGFFRPTLSSDPSHLTLSHLISLRHYYLIFHSGIPTNNHKGKGEQPCRTFSSLTRNISSYLSSSCLASHSNSHRGSTTSRRTDETRTRTGLPGQLLEIPLYHYTTPLMKLNLEQDYQVTQKPL